MENLKLAPHLLDKVEWVSGKNHDEMNALSYIQLREDGSVYAYFKDDSSMEVTDLFSSNIINSYRDHQILVTY